MKLLCTILLHPVNRMTPSVSPADLAARELSVEFGASVTITNSFQVCLVPLIGVHPSVCFLVLCLLYPEFKYHKQPLCYAKNFYQPGEAGKFKYFLLHWTNLFYLEQVIPSL